MQGPFRHVHYIEVRVHGYDCPEVRSTDEREREAGRRARDFAEAWLTDNHVSMVTKPDPDKYGRWLADLYSDDTSEHLGDLLWEAGLAVPYNGTSKTKRWREVHL